MKYESLDTKEKVLTPEKIREEERAKEEKEYLRRIAQLTHRIKAVQEKFTKAVTAGRGSKAGICITNCDEFTKAQAANLNSRLKDAARLPAVTDDSSDVSLNAPSPFTGAPPTIIVLKPGRVAKRVHPPPNSLQS